jgi:hypothetical protein
MAHEILSIKLCELEEQISRLSSRIHLSETADHDQLRQEIRALSKECTETELSLREKLRLSKAEAVTVVSKAYEETEQLIQKAKTELETQAAGRDDGAASVEEKILLAEYVLDFAVEAANRALLLSMEAIDAQLTSQEKERNLS